MMDEPATAKRFPLFPGIVIGALLGAVGLVLLPQVFKLLFMASAGDWSGLSGILMSALADAFTTPWGAIGALIGGTMAWKRLRVRPVTDAPTGESDDSTEGEETPASTSIWTRSWRILPWKKLQPGEGMLAWGLASLALTLAGTHVVMGIALALVVAPVALILLCLGFLRARSPEESVSGQAAGFGLFLLGLAALSVVGFGACAFSYELAFHTYHPEAAIRRYGAAPERGDWGKFIGSCLLPLVFLAPALKLWTDWSPTRRVVWCVVFGCFPFAAFAAHQLLVANGGALTA